MLRIALNGTLRTNHPEQSLMISQRRIITDLKF